MKSDMLIRSEGLEILFKVLGDVDAERFLVLLSKEKFNYTKWQRDLWKDKSIDEVIEISNTLEKNYFENNN